MHCRKSLLFDNETAWTKKNHSNMLDVTMSSFDGAEVCELIGLFLLDNLSEKYGKNILGGRSNNREVLGVNRRLIDDSEAPVNLRVTFILLLLFRNIIGRGRLILIDDVTVNVFLFTGSYSLLARL